MPLSLTACGCYTACAPSALHPASLMSSAHTFVQLLNYTPVETHKPLMVHAFHADSTNSNDDFNLVLNGDWRVPSTAELQSTLAGATCSCMHCCIEQRSLLLLVKML